MRKLNLLGHRFGRWEIIGPAVSSKRGQSRWVCRCDCGVVKEVSQSSMRSGDSTSCGCYSMELTIKGKHTTHGLRHTSEYRSWVHMKDRCYNPKDKRYGRYGGRGITVCDEWRDSFITFYDDMGPKPFPKAQIDRIDNDQGYRKSNCRWVSVTTNTRNTSRNKMLVLGVEKHCIAEWAEILNMSPYSIASRINMGWSDQDALTRPLRTTKRSRGGTDEHLSEDPESQGAAAGH